MSNYLQWHQKHDLYTPKRAVIDFHKISRLSQNLNVFYHRDLWQNAFLDVLQPMLVYMYCVQFARNGSEIKLNETRRFVCKSDLKPLFFGMLVGNETIESRRHFMSFAHSFPSCSSLSLSMWNNEADGGYSVIKNSVHICAPEISVASKSTDDSMGIENRCICM